MDSGSAFQGCSGCVGSRPQLFFSAPPDTVKFGEVALQPPELTAKPRMSTSRDQVSRGGGVALFAPRCCLVQGTQVESTMFSLGLSYWAGLGSL